jgi:phosphatidylinositol-bisphosphatase
LLATADVTARFDSVFWCGDLNFRLERRRSAVEGRVSEYNDAEAIPHFEELLSADQLSKYITEGDNFTSISLTVASWGNG